MFKTLAASLALVLCMSSIASATCTCNTDDIQGPLRKKVINELKKDKFSAYVKCMKYEMPDSDFCFIQQARKAPKKLVEAMKAVQ